jgi:hypothetical protein
VVTVRVKVMTGKSRYGLIVVDRALYAAAASCGNYTAASRKLKAEGVNVPVRTLQTWCQQSHASRYGEIREEVQNDSRRQLAAAHEDVARKASERVRAGLDDVDVKSLPERDRPGALRNLEVTAGIATDKASALRGQTTEVVQHLHVHEVFAKLESRWPGIIQREEGDVDGTAEEIDAPELPEKIEQTDQKIDPPTRRANRRRVYDKREDDRRGFPDKGGAPTP